MDEPLVSRYWCHMCSQMVSPAMDADIKCPYCEEGFLEEMNSREDPDTGDLGSDRALSLWAPILLGMMGGTTRRRRYHRREDYDVEFDQDREAENYLHTRRRRSSAAVLQLLQGIRAELSSESDNPEATRLRERERDQEDLLLINSFDQALVLNNQRQNQNSDHAPPVGSSLGDYFVGPGLEMLLQHLAENDPNRYGTPPAQKEAIEAMQTVKIDGSLSCPVCLDDFEAGAEAKKMPCNHKFHPGCILPWLELHSSCPVCRFQMPADESKTSNPTDNRSERASGGSSEDGGNGNNRLWIPFQWPFSGLFSSSAGSQRNSSSNSGSSSSSSRASGDNQNHTYEN